MKQTVKYRILSIPGKVTVEVRIAVDDHGAEFNSNMDGIKFTSLNIYPIITIGITRLGERDENGMRVKAPYNPNDSLGMTKFNLPVLYDELCGIQNDMKKPELYTYHGKRLELNEELAEKIRRVFMVGNTTVELSAVVITQTDESRVEGIKMKFNNEASSVLLTLNELTSLVYNIDHLDIDNVAINMYKAYIAGDHKSATSSGYTVDFPLPPVDIVPKVV